MNVPQAMLATGLLLTSVVFVAVPATAQPSDAKSEIATVQLWFGTMTAQNVRQFRFLLELTRQDGDWTGTLISLDEGGREFEMANLVNSDSRFTFELKSTGAVYEGTLHEDNRLVSGTWRQRGGEFKLDFRQVKQRPLRDIKSAWKGTINAVIQRLDVAFVELETGEFLFDSISQKAGGFIAEDESTEDEVIFRVPGVHGTFRGSYSDDKSKIEGTWSQGVAQLELLLEKVDAESLVAEEVPRPQTPKPPFPYSSRDVSFVSSNKDVTLSGTLTTPRGEIAAGVVLISGSGPQDRDESLLDHKPFLVIADHFSRRGIAVLRYDDRGIGKSGGEFANATSFDFADDAEGALEYLRSLPEFNGVPIGLCGHSEGGLIAPLVGARNDSVAFVVMMAGTGVNGEQILYRQSRLIMEAEGMTAEEIETDTKFQRILLSAVVKHLEASPEELQTKVMEATKDKFTKQETKGERLEQMVKAGVEKLTTPWFRTFLTYDPKESLTQLRCPVLVINGEKDLQVDPQQNLPAIRAALQEGGNKRFEIIEYAQLNHLFQLCKTGSVSEYQDIEETFNAQPLAEMTEWILNAVK